MSVVHDHLLLGTTASSAGERKEYQCLRSTVYETFAIGLTLTTSMAVPGMSMARIGMAAFRSNQSKLTQAQGEGDANRNCYEK